jgi:eukaryotic-like serine/threonine-protein kinase
MAIPTTIDDLLKLIRKSGMVEDPRLDAFLDKWRVANALPTDVKKMAGLMVKDALLTMFQAEQFLMGKWRGFTIGKYKLLERIGFGGMGQVFLCEHMYMRRRVAIKVLPPAKAQEPAALGRFYREARAAAALDHPNIVRTHDIDQDGQLHFLVMEYVDGSSMLDIIKKINRPMDVLRACHYVYQSAHGLDHAYRVGVIHRDIKPGNILVDRWGVAKILDMGLARFYHTEADDMLTLKYDEKSVLGTADYVAPEQCVNSHEVDVRADIYSLGCTFYFLLAGHPPFPDGTIAQKLVAHQKRNPTPIRTLRPDVPEGVAMILDRMLTKDFNERYQTPQEVYEALMPYVQVPIPAPPEEEMPQLSPAARESLTSGGSGTLSGSHRQDSAILRAEMMSRSGRMATTASGTRVPAVAGVGTGGGGNGPPPSGTRPGYREQPPANGAPNGAPRDHASNGSRAAIDTRKLASTTDRTPVAAKASSSANPHPLPQAPRKGMAKRLFGLHPVVRIVSEALLVFGVVMLLWWVGTILGIRIP